MILNLVNEKIWCKYASDTVCTMTQELPIRKLITVILQFFCDKIYPSSRIE